VKDINAALTSEHAALNADLTANTLAMTCHGDDVNTWVANTSKQINQRLNEVNSFIKEELSVDIPTGERQMGQLCLTTD